MKNKPEPCKFLSWDSDFFGFRIGSISNSILNPELMVSINDWSSLNQIDCLYFLARADDVKSIRVAEDNNFHMVEIRVTYEGVLKDWNPETRPRTSEKLRVRPVHSGDIRFLQEIAGYSYPNSRWYFDPCFTEEKCQLYFQTWIKKSAEGGADFVLVAEVDGEILGYISGNKVKNKPEGVYELTAVRTDQRRHGIGHELFKSGLDWYVKAGVERVTVNTQGRNLGTHRMIQRHGFLPKSIHLYYHKWFTPCGKGNGA